MLADSLRSAGHEVVIAQDERTALELARLKQPDVVFFEVAQPDLDGYAVARGIQELFAWRRPLLVAFSAQPDQQPNYRSREAGIDLLLGKPVDLGLLRGLLRRFQSILQDMEGFDPGL